MTLRERLSAALAHPRFPWLAALVVLVLLLPSLRYGMILDDHLHRVMLSGRPGLEWTERPAWDLFRFVPDDAAFRARAMEEGALTWMSSPTVKATLFRPLASLSRALDHAVAPDDPWVAHAHSLLWAVALILVASRLFQSIFADVKGLPAWVVGLATWMYAADEGHAYVAAWIANRNALQAMVFAWLALDSHLRWRRTGSRLHAALAPALLVVGLLCGEMALSVTAWMFAWAVFLEHGSWSRRALGLVPSAIVVVVWRIVYNLLEYGAGGSQLYVDPVHDPLRFVAAVAERLPLLTMAQLTPIPAELGLVLGSDLPVMVAALVVLAVVTVAAARTVRNDALAAFFAVGGLLSAIPSCATFPHDRLLLPMGLGAAGLAALLLARTGEATHEAGTPGLLGRIERAVALALVACLAVLSPLNIPARTASLSLIGQHFDRAARSLDCVPDIEHKTVVFVHGPDFFTTAWTPVMRADEGLPYTTHIRVLGSSYEGVEVTRVAPDALELRPDEGYLTAFLDLVMWSPDQPFTVGQRFVYSDLDIEVLEVTPDHRPAAIRCHFVAPLEDPRFAFVAWSRQGYRLFELPAVGERVRIEGVPLMEDVLGPVMNGGL